MIGNLTKKLLEYLEDGSRQIYERYEAAVKTLETERKRKLAEKEKETRSRANQIVADSELALKRNLEAMAENGYYAGGETVQARLAANADKNRQMTALSEEKAAFESELLREESEESEKLLREGEKEAREHEEEMTKLLLEQANRDREFEAEERERQSRKQAAQTESKEEKGLVPELSANAFLENLTTRYTRYDSDAKKKILDRLSLRKALDGVLRDSTLSLAYRYELYLIGKAMGYLE